MFWPIFEYLKKIKNNLGGIGTQGPKAEILKIFLINLWNWGTGTWTLHMDGKVLHSDSNSEWGDKIIMPIDLLDYFCIDLYLVFML